VIRSDSKIDEDWEGKIKRKEKDLEKERERNKRGSVVQRIRFLFVFLHQLSCSNILTLK